jgi:hypothetical protein
MSTTFDELTLAEVEEVSQVALGGRSISDITSDPLMVAAGVMWAIKKRDDPGLQWDAFKANTRMGDIKRFSEQMEEEQTDPLGMSMNGRPSSEPTSATSGT